MMYESGSTVEKMQQKNKEKRKDQERQCLAPAKTFDRVAELERELPAYTNLGVCVSVWGERRIGSLVACLSSTDINAQVREKTSFRLKRCYFSSKTQKWHSSTV